MNHEERVWRVLESMEATNCKPRKLDLTRLAASFVEAEQPAKALRIFRAMVSQQGHKRRGDRYSERTSLHSGKRRGFLCTAHAEECISSPQRRRSRT